MAASVHIQVSHFDLTEHVHSDNIVVVSNDRFQVTAARPAILHKHQFIVRTSPASNTTYHSFCKTIQTKRAPKAVMQPTRMP